MVDLDLALPNSGVVFMTVVYSLNQLLYIYKLIPPTRDVQMLMKEREYLPLSTLEEEDTSQLADPVVVVWLESGRAAGKVK